MRGDRSHDIALHLGLIGIEGGQPIGGRIETRERAIDARVAIRIEAREAFFPATEADTIGAALHTHLVPQVVEGKRVRNNRPQPRVLNHVKRGRALGRIAHIARHDERLIARRRLGNRQLTAATSTERLARRSAFVAREAHITRCRPEGVAFLGRTRKARERRPAKHGRAHLFEFFGQRIEALVVVVDEVFQEQVEIDARELLAQHARAEIRSRQAVRRARVALIRKRLLHADAALHEHIEDLLLRVEFRGLPHLARNCRKLRRLFRKSARRKRHAQRHLVGVARRNVRIGEESHRA